MSFSIARPAAVALGLLVDRVVSEPPTAFHPVAWFGSVMAAVEKHVWHDTKAAGALYACVGTSIGWSAGRALRSTTVAVAIAVAGNALRSTASQVGDAAASGDLAEARGKLRALVGRDAQHLDVSGISAAIVESVAENTVDAVIAPVFWGLVAGAPGALTYRAINTMDAMVGHHNSRYGNFGTAAARADDIANYVPARLFAALVAAVRPGDRQVIWEVVRRDARAHPSPNAGVAESAMAAALGIELGGPLRYGDRYEDRPTLGTGRRPKPADVPAANSVSNQAEALVVVLLAGRSLTRWLGQRR